MGAAVSVRVLAPGSVDSAHSTCLSCRPGRGEEKVKMQWCMLSGECRVSAWLSGGLLSP